MEIALSHVIQKNANPPLWLLHSSWRYHVLLSRLPNPYGLQLLLTCLTPVEITITVQKQNLEIHYPWANMGRSGPACKWTFPKFLSRSMPQLYMIGFPFPYLLHVDRIFTGWTCLTPKSKFQNVPKSENFLSIDVNHKWRIPHLTSWNRSQSKCRCSKNIKITIRLYV